MRKEPFGVGSFVHVVKRGARGFPIVRDEDDRMRFLLMLRHFNDSYMPTNWYRDIIEGNLQRTFTRPSVWPEQKKTVYIHAFCLVENHFHILLEEIQEGGVAQFMQRLSIGMAKHFNEKYHERGSLFQGSYRSRTVEHENYLKYVSVYIQVKNAFDMFPQGYTYAVQNFETAFEWACVYAYSSLGDQLGICDRSIVEKDMLHSLITPGEYEAFAQEMIFEREQVLEEIAEHAKGHFE